MTKIKILFDTNCELIVKLDNNDFVRRWSILLAEELAAKEILQTDTFSSFFTENESIEYLNKAIDQVNNFLKVNFVSQTNDFDNQEYYNLLHGQFEKLVGVDWSKPSRLMTIAPKDIQLAIRHINRFCHRLERRPYKIESWLRVEFDTSRRELLVDNDYKLFSPMVEAKTVYLDYSTLGKSLYECYTDGLDPTYAGMKVQEHYCANFIMLFDQQPEIDVKKFNQWLEKYKVDPKLSKSNGAIPLGKIESIESLQTVLKSRKIHKITLE